MEEPKIAASPEPAEAGQGAGAPRKKRKKLPIVAGVMAAVVLAAGIGFFVWHEQPSFCNAICHSPMDPYVEGYESGDDTLLVTAHAKAGQACLDCHEPTLGQQIGEATAWLSGNFSDPMGETGIGTTEFCLKCHDDGDASTGKDWEDIVAATKDFGDAEADNPHQNHNAHLECGDCHSVHGTSQLYCTQCHNYQLPEGWDYYVAS